jgi:hypothetical protein
MIPGGFAVRLAAARPAACGSARVPAGAGGDRMRRSIAGKSRYIAF